MPIVAGGMPVVSPCLGMIIGLGGGRVVVGVVHGDQDTTWEYPEAALRAIGSLPTQRAVTLDSMDDCAHIASVGEVTPSGTGCEDCLRIGGRWFHLRLCMTCGKVGCCDRSPNQHATGHFHEVGHPVIRSFEPGERWLWCYEDEVIVDPA